MYFFYFRNQFCATHKFVPTIFDSQMGLSTQGEGRIHVTDMDTIEKSNLSRQFLFRERDIGSLKSEVAAREAVEMNKTMKISVKSVRVSKETESKDR